MKAPAPQADLIPFIERGNLQQLRAIAYAGDRQTLQVALLVTLKDLEECLEVIDRLESRSAG